MFATPFTLLLNLSGLLDMTTMAILLLILISTDSTGAIIAGLFFLQWVEALTKVAYLLYIRGREEQGEDYARTIRRLNNLMAQQFDGSTRIET